jgi:hypothetical protein
MSEFDEEAWELQWEQQQRQHAYLLDRFTEADERVPKFDPREHDLGGRRLYHYTMLSALEGIVKDKCLWASDVQYMNDASEFTYARDLIDREMQKIRSLRRNRKLFEPFHGIKRLADPFEFKYGPTPYIACFCEADDLLSQWRGYGPSDSVSLELDFQKVAYFLIRACA